MENNNAAQLVSSALLGTDGKTIIVADNAFFIKPPTIKTIVGAGQYLSVFGGADTLADALGGIKDMENMCKALSWFIKGDESLADELMGGTMEEVVVGLEASVELMGLTNFIRLSVLAKNVKGLIAKQR